MVGVVWEYSSNIRANFSGFRCVCSSRRISRPDVWPAESIWTEHFGGNIRNIYVYVPGNNYDYMKKNSFFNYQHRLAYQVHVRHTSFLLFQPFRVVSFSILTISYSRRYLTASASFPLFQNYHILAQNKCVQNFGLVGWSGKFFIFVFPNPNPGVYVWFLVSWKNLPDQPTSPKLQNHRTKASLRRLYSLEPPGFVDGTYWDSG